MEGQNKRIPKLGGLALDPAAATATHSYTLLERSRMGVINEVTENSHYTSLQAILR